MDSNVDGVSEDKAAGIDAALDALFAEPSFDGEVDLPPPI